MVNGIFGLVANLSGLVENLAGLSCTQFCSPMCTSEFNLVDRLSAACRWDASVLRQAREGGVVEEEVGKTMESDAGSESKSAIQTGSRDVNERRRSQFAVDDAGLTSLLEEVGSRGPESRGEGNKSHILAHRRETELKQRHQSGEVTSTELAGSEVLDQGDTPSSSGDVSSCQPSSCGARKTTSAHSLGRGAMDEQACSVSQKTVEPGPVRLHPSTFAWRRQKEEVLWVLASFTMLLVTVMVTYCLGRRQSTGFAAVWMLDASLCALLWSKLWSDYEGSQTFCRTVAPVLFAMPAFASLFPIGVCRMMGGSGCMGLAVQIYDIMLLIGLPCLLSAAPIMAWQAALTLSLVIPFMFLVLFLGESSPSLDALSAGHLSCACCCLILAIAPLVLLRVRAERKLLSALEATEAALAESVLRHRKAESSVDEKLQALAVTRMENADKISRMRQFISYIFHEIRVPFNAVVLGIGHMLAENISEEQREILKMIDSSASSMIHILNDVLDMGKIEAGRLHLQKQPFNMGELVSSLVWSYQEIFDSKGVEFSLCIDDKTNQLLSSWDVMGDKHRVGQVLANYLSNAAKFTPRGGKVCLRVTATSLGLESLSELTGDAVMDVSSLHLQGEAWATKGPDGGRQSPDASKQQNMPAAIARVTLSVEDTGIGISEEDQTRLFEPYMQVHSTSSQAGGGTGLGLCFSKRIVELASGTIGVQSKLGKGSTFLCTFPFELVQTSPNGQVQPCRSTFDVSRALGGRPLHRCSSTNSLSAASLEGRVPKVLVVEDNQVNRRILNKLLSSFSVESQEVENGQEAVDLCKSGARFDMILIDKEMPVMDGPEATRQLRAMGITSPIVGLTGNALESERDHFLAAGVDDFFTKPLSRNQLLKLLEAYGLMAKSKSKEGIVQQDHMT